MGVALATQPAIKNKGDAVLAIQFTDEGISKTEH